MYTCMYIIAKVTIDTFMGTCFHALQFCGEDIVTHPVFSTGVVVEFYTLSTGLIVSPLLLHHSAAWHVPRWIDGLLAWI